MAREETRNPPRAHADVTSKIAVYVHADRATEAMCTNFLLGMQEFQEGRMDGGDKDARQ